MIEVLRPGQFTTIQDLGRFGYRSMGVPVSGPMDSSSASRANELLGNHANAPLIEMAYVGATFLFHNQAVIAISGAECEVKLNDQILDNQSIIHVNPADTLSFGLIKNGNFLYFAISGGFQSEIVLGSTCNLEAITGIGRLKKGMKVYFDENQQEFGRFTSQKREFSIISNGFIDVEKGPEFDLLSDDEVSTLITTEFSVSLQSNRMGFLLNEQLKTNLKESISSPVQPGTIQLTQGGQLIVLMKDAQTIGGYPRILQLTEYSIDSLVQLPVNSPFYFRLID